jgi:hypothetical protein
LGLRPKLRKPKRTAFWFPLRGSAFGGSFRSIPAFSLPLGYEEFTTKAKKAHEGRITTKLGRIFTAKSNRTSGSQSKKFLPPPPFCGFLLRLFRPRGEFFLYNKQVEKLLVWRYPGIMIPVGNRYARFILFALLLVFLNSCGNLFNKDLTIDADKETFEKERALWNSQGIKNYHFIYEFFNDAGPAGPVKITVRENEAPVIENSNQHSEYVVAENIPQIYDFINGSFDFIEAVKNGTYDGFKIVSVTLQISYDAQYHYPREVIFSEGYAEPVDGGGYYTLKITEFVPLDK